MKENGVIRRRLSGKEADPYIGQARKILGDMKNIMQMGGIKQLTWTKDLQNGVRIMVASIFGQDEVRILVPIGSDQLQPQEKLVLNTKSTQRYVYWGERSDIYRWSKDKGSELLDETSVFIAGVARNTEKLLAYFDNGSLPYTYYLWSVEDGFKSINQVTNQAVYRGGISSDGEYMAGVNINGELFIYSNGVSRIHNIGIIYKIVGISDTGTYVAGMMDNGDIFRWSAQGGMKIIANQGDGFDITKMSADGSTLLLIDNNSGIACYWHEQTGINYIGVAAGYIYSFPYGISSDGTFIVGQIYTEDADGYPIYHAFKWSKKDGMLPLQPTDVRTELHNTLDNRATDVSDDGTMIVGYGINDVAGELYTGYYGLVWDGDGKLTAKIAEASNMNLYIVELETKSELTL